MWLHRLIVSALALACFFNAPLHAQVPAFPGALGYGANATGGRNGTVYHVTTLADSGAGSFRDAVSQPNRTVVFDVGGYITLVTEVSVKSHITIAGQTAPGGGIGIKGREVSFGSQSDIICRFVRFRPGDGSGSTDNGLSLYRSKNIILDHVSIEFAKWNDIDGVSDDWQNFPVDNITVQNSIIANPIGQQFGAHTESVAGSWSWFYNVFANSHNRNPLAKIDTVFINNVLYNHSAGYTTHTSTTFDHDIINNYFIFGPGTGSSPDNTWFQIDKNQRIYYSGNLKDNNKDGALNGSLTTPYWYQGVGTVLGAPWSPITPTVPIFATELAYRHDASAAGTFPRDEIDALVISQVKTLGNGTTGTGAGTAGPGGGLYTSQTQTGLGNNGFGTITGTTPPTDTDGDAMPDFWELAMGSNPNSANPLTNTASGYTLLENYLNWLAAPHGVTRSNTPVIIDLRQYTAGFATNATYMVSNAVNGSVVIMNGSQARFTPTTDFVGLGSFNFYVGDGGFGYLIPISVLVTSITPPANGVLNPGAVVSVALPPAPLPANLFWRGDGTMNAWNTTAMNWFDGTNLVAFKNGDHLLFDDSGSNTPSIKLSGALAPGAVIFESTNNYNLTGSGALSGSGSLTKAGPGVLLIGTTNTAFAGSIDLQEGTLALSNSVSIGSGLITMSGGALLTLPGSGGATFVAGGIVVPEGENVTISSGGIGNGLDGDLFSGDDTSVLNLAGGVSFRATSSGQFNGFTGTINIQPGATLRFSANSSGNIYGSLNPTFIINGTMQPRNAGNTIRLGTISGGGTFTGPQSNGGSGNTTYEIGGDNSDATFSGVISSNSAVAGSQVALSKVGAGTLTLSGASTYTGGTVVNGGTLRVNNVTGSGTGTGTLLVKVNTTLAGTGTIGSATTVENGATLAPGTGTGVLKFNGDLTLGTSSLMQFELGTTRDRVDVAGALMLKGILNVTALSGFGVGRYTLFNFNPATMVNLSNVTFGTVPAGYNYSLSTNTPGRVDLLVLPSSTPPILSSLVTGNTLNFAWPADHRGWRLEVQTNSLSAGLGTNWTTVEGSADTNWISWPLDANGSVFFRLVYP